MKTGNKTIILNRSFFQYKPLQAYLIVPTFEEKADYLCVRGFIIYSIFAFLFFEENLFNDVKIY